MPQSIWIHDVRFVTSEAFCLTDFELVNKLLVCFWLAVENIQSINGWIQEGNTLGKIQHTIWRNIIKVNWKMVSEYLWHFVGTNLVDWQVVDLLCPYNTLLVGGWIARNLIDLTTCGTFPLPGNRIDTLTESLKEMRALVRVVVWLRMVVVVYYYFITECLLHYY